MRIRLDMDSKKKSNMFLRSLWSNFYTKTGNCAWNYFPYKIGKENKIILGHMSTGIGLYSVVVYYKDKGVIKELEFLNSDDTEICENEQTQIKEIIEISKKTYESLNESFFACTVQSFFSLSNNDSEYYSIQSVDDGRANISMQVLNYGIKDGQYIFQKKIRRFLDVLSILTNVPFYFADRIIKEKEIREIKYYEDDEYIDGYPVADENLLLPRYAKIILDKVVKFEEDDNDDQLLKLLRACKHFHSGRKYDALLLDLVIPAESSEKRKALRTKLMNARDVCDNSYEMAVVSYFSSLEVLSTIVYEESKERCKTCNQLNFRISARVKDLLIKYLGEDMGKYLHKYYASRSQFLHTGNSLTSPYIGTTIPQLVVDNAVNVELIFEVPLLNLREYVSYCIRRVIKDYFLS